MKDYVITPRARADIAGIWGYTDQTWGRAQADRYVRGLDAVFRGLAEGRVTSRPVEIRPGYRKAAYGVHVVFFRESATSVEVVRVLHQRMDVGSQLRG